MTGLTVVPGHGYQGSMFSAGSTSVKAQADFDQTYVSSSELIAEFGCSREAIAARRRRGDLPEPIRVTRPNGGVHVMLWLRAEIEPYLARWRSSRG